MMDAEIQLLRAMQGAFMWVGLSMLVGVLVGLIGGFAAGQDKARRMKDFLRWAMGMPPSVWDQIPQEVRDRWKEMAR
jgi:hypothetical protein